MGDTIADAAGTGPDFDLTQFYPVFFEEAGENLDQLERILLGLDLGSADSEALNGIFRCAHSIKGGAATFGFADVAELTHHMESLLEAVSASGDGAGSDADGNALPAAAPSLHMPAPVFELMPAELLEVFGDSLLPPAALASVVEVEAAPENPAEAEAAAE